MKTIHAFKGPAWFYRLKTMQRLWFFYALFFLLPLSLWTVFYYFQLNKNISNKYRNYYREIVTDRFSLYKDRINDIESSIELFQQNYYFLDYVEDWNMSVAERVVSFNINIRPLVEYMLSSNELLDDIFIYSRRSRRIPPYYFINEWDKNFIAQDIINPLGLKEALWQYRIDSGGLFYCYLSVFNKDFSSTLADVVLSVNASKLLGMLYMDIPGLRILMVQAGKTYILGREGINIFSGEIKSNHIQELELPEFGAVLYFFNDISFFSKEDIPDILIPVFLLFALLSSVILVSFRLINDAYRAELRSRDARYYALQAQLNPHFLLNSLENIRMIALMQHDDETSGLIYKLARIMSYSLRQNNLVSSLAKEIENCRNYLELCIMRMGNNLSFTIQCPDELKNFRCPKFLLQPIVENAVEHAFDFHSGKKMISISADKNKKGVAVSVADNGCGMNPEQLEGLRASLRDFHEKDGEELPETRHGIGILNVHERIKIFYGDEYGIEVDSSAGAGTVFTLKLGSP
ncbi:sensor histidine kinase [Leadbettera azotonutricia]|uniref:histidine kinase n=1 Tax=Leadbettera azotonutricia (strain ATCC BAA-888 / DSM 13862 / ZAS-9) TaxID=545695 RepID=F5YEJ1_LEAAZ|nr:histidine kinase [Leadbettera azotonutricia]AEF82893.1 histidine kinase [Leadbettera azotonutricia ZAS-9]